MTAASAIAAGGHVTADQIRGVAPVSAVKGADQSVTSNSTSWVADSDLSVPVTSGTWLIAASLMFTCAVSPGGVQAEFLVPVGATLAMGAVRTGTGGNINDYRGASSAFASVGNANGDGGIICLGTATVTNAGNISVSWMQTASSTTPSVMKSGSVLAAWKIA